MTGARKGLWLTTGAAAITGGLIMALLGATPPVPKDEDTGPAMSDRVASAAYRSRAAFPEVPSAPSAGDPEPSQPGDSVPAPLAPPPPAQAEIPVGHKRAAAPTQSASGWINDYRGAVCGCTTRACVRDLQARFLNTMGGTEYDEQRDGSTYSQASREAIRCYAALPEDS